jgi:hypothetical protein
MVKIEKSIQKTDKIWFDFDLIRFDMNFENLETITKKKKKNNSILIYFSSCFEKNQYYFDITEI